MLSRFVRIFVCAFFALSLTLAWADDLGALEADVAVKREAVRQARQDFESARAASRGARPGSPALANVVTAGKKVVAAEGELRSANARLEAARHARPPVPQPQPQPVPVPQPPAPAPQPEKKPAAPSKPLSRDQRWFELWIESMRVNEDLREVRLDRDNAGQPDQAAAAVDIYYARRAINLCEYNLAHHEKLDGDDEITVNFVETKDGQDTYVPKKMKRSEFVARQRQQLADAKAKLADAEARKAAAESRALEDQAVCDAKEKELLARQAELEAQKKELAASGAR